MHVKELFLSSISFYASHLNRDKIHLTSCLHGIACWALLITPQSLATGFDLHGPNSSWVQQEVSFFPLGEWEADVAWWPLSRMERFGPRPQLGNAARRDGNPSNQHQIKLPPSAHGGEKPNIANPAALPEKTSHPKA